jgi:predicted unusual protein kinase regulating ubiquinone biosynthesis (AarF/ABC1/UbiB family)
VRRDGSIGFDGTAQPLLSAFVMATTRGRLSRYRDIAWFLAKYGRADFLHHSDLEIPSAEDRPETAQNAEALARDLESLGPTFIKLGQLLSTRADLFSRPYLDALARLQDDIEPFEYDAVERIVQEELGTRLSKAFAEFDPVPVAAASLGQVHRAVLRDGREVAVKVQRPDIREQVLKDLDALDEVARLMDRFTGARRNLDAARVLEEFRRSLLAELDYRQEAQHLVTVSHELREFEQIVVPLPIDDYTTSRVLTMDFVRGTKVTAVSGVERTEFDGEELADALFRAYLHQILVAGTFHADPHPGNVFLTEDHRIALLDLGMVGRLTPPVQERLLRLLLAIGEGRGDEAASVAIELGERRDDFEEAQIRRTIMDLVAKYHQAPLRELNVGRVMLEMSRGSAEHGLKMSPELAMLGKTLLNLDEIGRTLAPEFDVNAAIRRNAMALMRRRMVKAASPGNVLTSLLDVKEFAERLPGRVNRILDSMAANDLRLKVEIIDRGSIIEGFQKVANRIALGLVLAALIVGAAMLMQVQTEFTILGYPGLAMLLFIAAAGGGFWMAWVILAGDVHRRT